MRAVYEGICHRCSDPIHINDPIAITARHGYIHTTCHPGYED